MILFFHKQAGIIEEMIEDTFEGLEDDDIEEAAQEEVDKILWELTSGTLKSFCEAKSSASVPKVLTAQMIQ